MVTIEAMGMGCVPIAWDVATGTKEVVPPGAGMFAPLGDYAGCARLVLAACKDHASLSASLTAHARSKFSESAMWQAYEALLLHMEQFAIVQKPCSGNIPPTYKPPFRFFQLLPAGIRQVLRRIVGRSARLGFWLRDLRGL